MENMSNEELVALYQEGNDYAATVLWDKVINLVYKKIIGFKNIHFVDVEDKMSACHKAYTSAIRTFDVGKGFKFTTYLGQSAVFELIREGNTKASLKLRDAKKIKENTVSYHAISNNSSADSTQFEGFIDGLQVWDDYFTDNDVNVSKELIEAIGYAMDHVNEKYRPYIMEIFLGKSTQTDIANKTNSSPQCVYYQVKLFRRNVKNFIDFTNGKDVKLLN